jgi:hypothetical protein
MIGTPYYIPKIVQSILAKGCWKNHNAYGMITTNRNLKGTFKYETD